MEDEKSFCEGVVFTLLEVCGLHHLYTYKVIMKDNNWVDKIEITRDSVHLDDEIDLGKINKLHNLIKKSNYSQFIESSLYIGKDGVLTIK